MEHIYKSIDIKNYLICYFPLPDLAIEIIINNLKLAIDLNGYTNDNLKTYIMFNQKNSKELNCYIRSKYGKYRSNLSVLKKYQLIHLIHNYNINIPLKPFKTDLFKKFQEDNNIKLSLEHESIIINMNNNKTTLPVNTLIPIKINDIMIQKLYIYFKNISKKHISNFVLICKYNNNEITLINNTTVKIDYYKIALLYCYTTVLNNNLSFDGERTTDELYIEMKKLLIFLYEKCSLLRVNNNLFNMDILNSV